MYCEIVVVFHLKYCNFHCIWNKSLSHIVRIVKYDDNRILIIEITANQNNILLLCCYLPYECDMNYDRLLFLLNKFKCIIESANAPYVFILGDFNAQNNHSLSLVQNLLSSVKRIIYSIL